MSRSSPNDADAMRRDFASASCNADGSRTRSMPMPPPPATGFTITGYPIRVAAAMKASSRWSASM